MRVLIVTPAPRGSRAGNRVTAERAARFMRGLGHRTAIVTAYGGQHADMLLALHAYRSHAAITAFREHNPAAPLVVMLTGTDLYRPEGLAPESQESLRLADRLVVINAHASEDLPPEQRHKARIILQSVAPPGAPPPKYRSGFAVCVLGHLREEKDPFLATRAARLLPPQSRIYIRHAGGALAPEFERQAREEEAANPRYLWIGNVPRRRARELLARSRVMVLSSRIEGGAHVIGEAAVAGVPVLATRIAGNIGLLGADYSGYFPVGDAEALAGLLLRAEGDVEFLQSLGRQVAKLAERFAPAREAAAWAGLLHELI